ncbi:VIR protein [Plasmodium vivax]|uniref:VIR protein n=1 Tax=Plasmodium vivax TaxID=5855 RepID=A0A1G4HC45_PLAVI|nr:VIR protein [Plasmodium vivax]
MSEYIHLIKNTNDPILRYIALHLIDNYETSKQYFSKSGMRNHNTACELLNRWLDQKKSFFTHVGKCNENVQSWNNYIKPIWDKLSQNKNENWCKRVEYYSNTLNIPEKLLPPICYKHVPKNYNCTQPLYKNRKITQNMCNNIEEYCSQCKEKNFFKQLKPIFQTNATKTCSLNNNPDILSLPQEQIYCKECSSSIYTTALSVCVSFFGTLYILLFLYKFTPLGSKLSNGGRKKKRLQQQFIEELAHAEFERSRNNNPRSRKREGRLHYQ